MTINTKKPRLRVATPASGKEAAACRLQRLPTSELTPRKRLVSQNDQR